jgi:hypothetical protein
LAEDHGIVLLNGGGFDAPEWSLRVSLANLPDDVYDDIGRGVRTIARGYRDAFEAAKGNGGKVTSRYGCRRRDFSAMIAGRERVLHQPK